MTTTPNKPDYFVYDRNGIKRRGSNRPVIVNPLCHFTDHELEDDVRAFVQRNLPSVDYKDLLRAAKVAKGIQIYDEASRHPAGYGERNRLSVLLTEKEKSALRSEKDHAFSEKGMFVVIVTVSLAAFLQGFVQSSFNGSSLYMSEWGLFHTGADNQIGNSDWQLGAASASPFLFAACLGCPLSLPVNYWFGRRGGIGLAAFLVLCSSIAAIFARNWSEMFGIRVINGVGMGLKAVSTTILASETAVGFWRGSAILAWQLWVAFGIMMGFAFNLIFTKAADNITTYRLIQGAPLVPSLVLLVVVIFVCPESPRYHLLKGPNYSVEKAYAMLKRVRNTELQALRDIYLVYKSIEQENMDFNDLDANATRSPGFFWVMRDFARQFVQLFTQPRLYNAMISTSTVNLSQQLCGVNVCAFYSGLVFSKAGGPSSTITTNMAYSLGFGAINFVFALPAVKSIDTLGRRRWLLLTIPFMAVFMLGAGFADYIPDPTTRNGITACFLFLFAVAYSPGLGPIPFMLASESFPLTHRDAGTAWAISVNLFFAGLLAILFPSVNSGLGQKGSLFIFAVLNVVVFIMVFLFVEETKQRSLEELDYIFAVPKREFMNFKVMTYTPWVIRKYIFRQNRPKPKLYRDMIWGSQAGDLRRAPSSFQPSDDEPTRYMRHGSGRGESGRGVRPGASSPSSPSSPSSTSAPGFPAIVSSSKTPAPKLPEFAGIDMPDLVEMEEIYPPGMHVPFEREYAGGRSPTAKVHDEEDTPVSPL